MNRPIFYQLGFICCALATLVFGGFSFIFLLSIFGEGPINFIAVITLIAFTWLFGYFSQRLKSVLDNFAAELRERKVLHLARENHGLVTAEDLAMTSDFSLREAIETLEQLSSQKFCELRITEGGVRVFDFVGILSQDEKESAVSH